MLSRRQLGQKEREGRAKGGTGFALPSKARQARIDAVFWLKDVR